VDTLVEIVGETFAFFQDIDLKYGPTTLAPTVEHVRRLAAGVLYLTLQVLRSHVVATENLLVHASYCVRSVQSSSTSTSTPTSPEQQYYKLGIHLNWPRVYVTPQDSLRIRREVLAIAPRRCVQKWMDLPELNILNESQLGLKDVLDSAVYKLGGGGLRVMGGVKCIKKKQQGPEEQNSVFQDSGWEYVEDSKYQLLFSYPPQESIDLRDLLIRVPRNTVPHDFGWDPEDPPARSSRSCSCSYYYCCCCCCCGNWIRV